MQPGKQNPIRIDVSKYPNVKCICGSEYFKMAFTLKVIPALLSGTGKEELFTTPQFICTECGKLGMITGSSEQKAPA